MTGKALASALLDAVEDQSANERLLGAACELKSLLTGNKTAFSDLVVSAIQNWLGPPKKAGLSKNQIGLKVSSVIVSL